MKGFLLDTNILSELIRSHPEPRVERWVFAHGEQSLFLSSVTVGEMCRGFVMLPAGERRMRLEQWFRNTLIPRFENRILAVTYYVAERWGVLDGECQLKGIALNTADGMIAATALEHDLTLATRNVKDFANLGLRLLNPWDEGAS